MRRCNALLPAALVAALLAGTTVSRAADHIRVGTPEGSAYVFAPIDVGNGAGIFAKAGLEVEKINFGGGAKLEQAMSAGAIDMSVAGNIGLAYATKGVPEKAVAVVAGPPVEMSIIIRSDGDIKKVADLKGKSIGVGGATSLTAWLALQLAQHEGWGADGVKRVAVGDMSSLVAALETKNVDGIVGPVEGGYLLQQKGQGKVLLTYGTILHDFITHGMFASDALITQHPDTVRRFVHAWFDTIKYMRTHKAETIKLTQSVTHLPPDIAEKVYDLETPALSTDGKFDQKALAATLQSFVDLGQIDKLPPDVSKLYTTQFLP
jgi:ABC-type nitrate/sulfonate/bicarbonate transport system substrate-binding protein